MFESYISDEAGAVTVDWVVLTAALVGLGLAVAGVISAGLESQSGDIEASLDGHGLLHTSFGGAVATGFDFAGAAFDADRYQGRFDDMLASQADADRGALTTEDVANLVTTNMDQAIHWGTQAGVNGNQAQMQAQIDYALATEAFAVQNGYDVGVSSANNPSGLTSQDLIADYEARFGG